MWSSQEEDSPRRLSSPESPRLLPRLRTLALPKFKFILAPLVCDAPELLFKIAFHALLVFYVRSLSVLDGPNRL